MPCAMGAEDLPGGSTADGAQPHDAVADEALRAGPLSAHPRGASVVGGWRLGWGEGTRPGKLLGGDWNMTG